MSHIQPTNSTFPALAATIRGVSPCLPDTSKLSFPSTTSMLQHWISSSPVLPSLSLAATASSPEVSDWVSLYLHTLPLASCQQHGQHPGQQLISTLSKQQRTESRSDFCMARVRSWTAARCAWTTVKGGGGQLGEEAGSVPQHRHLVSRRSFHPGKGEEQAE